MTPADQHVRRTPPLVRAATEDDVPRLASTLARAFADSPWTRWLVDAEDHERRLTELYAIHLRVALAIGVVQMTADGDGAAAWMPSARAEEAVQHLARTGLDVRIGELLGSHVARAGVAEAALAPHAPREEHWELAAVGVVPERQGAGLGAALLRPMLDRCDAEGLPAALDTSSARNVAFYERLGFAVRAEVDVPGGPHVWLMRRPPGAR